MNGQLWQECYCGTEPVCSDCERCTRHCRCMQEGEQVTACDRASPGLRQKVAEHLEQGSMER